MFIWTIKQQSQISFKKHWWYLSHLSWISLLSLFETNRIYDMKLQWSCHPPMWIWSSIYNHLKEFFWIGISHPFRSTVVHTHKLMNILTIHIQSCFCEASLQLTIYGDSYEDGWKVDCYKYRRFRPMNLTTSSPLLGLSLSLLLYERLNNRVLSSCLFGRSRSMGLHLQSQQQGIWDHQSKELQDSSLEQAHSYAISWRICDRSYPISRWTFSLLPEQDINPSFWLI